MNLEPLHPSGWARARGYSHGIAVEGAARWVFVAGQVAWNEACELVGPGDFVAQFRQALANVRTVLESAGAAPGNLVRLTIYVTDKRRYLARLGEVGEAYRSVLGRHYPAMALVQVADLLEDGALVEIEATAALSTGDRSSG